MNITHAIIPAAGLGTRFLPYTKSIPKELLPIMNKPAIQFITQEGIASGITTFNIIINQDKHLIKDYLTSNAHFNNILATHNKTALVAELEKLIELTRFNYIPQETPQGLGHAILMAEHVVENNYCSILLPDEIMSGETPALAQLITIAQKYSTSVIAVQEVPYDMVSSYGIVAIKKELEKDIFEVNHLIEKPSQQEAPSNLAIIGRYVLSPSIFNALKKIKPGAGNEIQLTDGITEIMNNGEKVIAYKIDTIRHDIGNPEGWLKANIYYSMQNPLWAEKIKSYIQNNF